VSEAPGIPIELMFDLENSFRDHGKIAFEQQVIDADDGAGERVFHGSEENVCDTFRNCGEGGIECGARNRGDGFTEKPDGGCFAEGAGFSLKATRAG